MALQPEAVAYHTDINGSQYFFNTSTGGNNGVVSFNDSNIYFLSTNTIGIPYQYIFHPGSTYNINTQIYTYQYGDTSPASNASIVTTLQANGSAFPSNGTRRTTTTIGTHSYSTSPLFLTSSDMIQTGTASTITLYVATDNSLGGATIAVELPNTTIQRLS